MSSIKRVSVVSTGTVDIRPEHIRSDGSPALWWLPTSRRWAGPQPINTYLIEHAGGLVLFDTGQDRRSVTDPNYFPTGMAGRLNRRLPQPTDDPSLAPFTAAHDLFGDGSLILLPTPGHTPGSLSLLVRRPGFPPLLMVGDLTFDVHLMEHEHVPGLGRRHTSLETTRKVNALRQTCPDLVILPAHDPGAASRLATAEQSRRPHRKT